MVEIFITDSREGYDQSGHPDRVLYADGFISDCSFVSKDKLANFNDSIVGLDDEASRLMLIRLDEDIKAMITGALNFKANRFISRLPAVEKLYSTLFKFHKEFVFTSYLFQVVLDRFFAHFSIPKLPLTLDLSEEYYLTQGLAYQVKSSSYYPVFKSKYRKLLVKQAYYFFHRLISKRPKMEKTQIALVLFDIHNEFDLFKKFMELAKKENKFSITIVVVDSGNPADKKVDTSMYQGGNVKVVHLYEQKANLYTNYNSFYAACEKVNPLYSIYRKARLCEEEDVQYGFLDNVLSALSPDVCLYVNVQEYGRVVANVCAAYNIPSICVEYAFSFDTYNMEKRIRFDIRACISEVTAQNWVKHKDPTPRHDVIGFCKMDEWHDKLATMRQAVQQKPFDNINRTILFVSTWAPNPNSPLLTEKVKIVEQLSEFCFQHGWNLLIKKHPSEFDDLLSGVFDHNKYANQRIVEHSEMTLFDCIYYSDFICTQNSSAFVEALYLNKPFSYITTEGENLWANMSYFSREKAVGTFSSVAEYEQYLLTNGGEEAYRNLQAEFLKLQSKFLYKTDGMASERLLALAESFVK